MLLKYKDTFTQDRKRTSLIKLASLSQKGSSIICAREEIKYVSICPGKIRDECIWLIVMCVLIVMCLVDRAITYKAGFKDISLLISECKNLRGLRRGILFATISCVEESLRLNLQCIKRIAFLSIFSISLMLTLVHRSHVIRAYSSLGLIKVT